MGYRFTINLPNVFTFQYFQWHLRSLIWLMTSNGIRNSFVQKRGFTRPLILGIKKERLLVPRKRLGKEESFGLCPGDVGSEAQDDSELWLAAVWGVDADKQGKHCSWPCQAHPRWRTH